MLRTLTIAALSCWLGLLQLAQAAEPRAGDGTYGPIKQNTAKQNVPRPAATLRQPASTTRAALPSSFFNDADAPPATADAPDPSDRNAPGELLAPTAKLAPSDTPLVEPYQEGGQFAECCEEGPRCGWIDWDNCDCVLMLQMVARLPLEVRGEYLSWWLEGQAAPPLVTTSPPDTPRPQAGVLNQLNTTILFGNDSSLNDEQRSGARVNMKWWLNCDNSIEVEWFGLGDNVSEFNASSDGSTILARPFFNLSTGAQDAFVVAYPGQLSGEIHIRSSSRLVGTNLGLTQNLFCAERCRNDVQRLDFLYGFRYMRLSESLVISDRLTVIEEDGVIEQGTQFATFDEFSTNNNFYGLSLGLSGERQVNRWAFGGVGRVGLGVTNERITIFGNSSASSPEGVTENFSGGLLALPTNIGSRTRNQLAFVPQLELKAAYLVTQHFQLTAGYDLMYWSSLARPGQQIDTLINPTQASGEPLVGEPAPIPQSRQTDMWIQGFSFGAEWHF